MPLSATGAGLLNTGIQQAGGFLGDLWGIINQAGQREHQYQMTDYLYSKDLEQWNRQNAWNLDMWNRNNEYNSPEQQMQRFKNAGLNPNLIYGQGSPGTSQMLPSAQSPTAKGEAQNTFKRQNIPIDMWQTIMGVRMQEQQLKNMEQVRKNEEQRNDILKAEAIIKAKDAGFRGQELAMIAARFGWDAKRFGQESRLWETNYQANELNLKKLGMEIEEIGTKIGLNKAQTYKLMAWVKAWVEDGINIERDNAVQRKVQEGFNFITGGLKSIPENVKTRTGIMPWQKIDEKGNVVNIWD